MPHDAGAGSYGLKLVVACRVTSERRRYQQPDKECVSYLPVWQKQRWARVQ